MKRPLLVITAALATLFAASAAEAARVNWSIGVDVAPVSAYVSSGPVWQPAPAAYVPRRAVYAPAPVYAPRAVYRQPEPVYVEAPAYVEPYDQASVSVYAPAPVYVAPRRHLWLPPLPPLPRLPRLPWDHHDRWHHEVGHSR